MDDISDSEPVAAEFKPHMTEAETACYRRYLAKAKTYLEFGCGGSTAFAVKSGLERIWSVESDADWVAKLKQDSAIRAAVKTGRLHFLVPEIGDVGMWGKPASNASRHLWHRYHSRIWRRIDPGELDLVLIDGRFRVACASQAALRVKEGCIIILHDFWNRPAYHVVLEFLDELERADNLGVFAVKRPVDINKVLNCLFDHFQNFA